MAEGASNPAVEKRVMVAIDETDSSYYALIWVLENLKESIADSPLFLFTALPPPSSYTPGLARSYFHVASSTELVYTLQENDKKVRCGLLEKAKDICAERGVAAISITEVGDPGTTICDTVEKLNINLLVLGDRGLGRIKRALATIAFKMPSALSWL
ncbi:uncharacterized protein LOC120081769 isoform X2 [Benincasa hispida]|uniref:uncharacterized protein LOC120081769 isoform X2 n=1 Tax=Benincasa hispida TaxID=102211 RepID=UPI0018FF15AE|nr:uncharacterized protein LOC120081769 isoform X2 [Benincasa hispida]XP_038892857.1 uncharacterized protein LOC120081769 isoform X2 [Benincasa hispida]XP_038892858.1 uncharacterized protein LOC120081769 isoform X2 [Benincasa hispida]